MTEQARQLFILAAHHYPAQTMLGGAIFLAVLWGLIGLMAIGCMRMRKKEGR